MSKVNHLGHELILRNNSMFENVYYCEKCKIKVFKYPNVSFYYSWFGNNGFSELILNCDECIIKQIIE